MRTMKSNKWLGKVVEKKLLKIKCEVGDEFGESEHGRSHWNEIEVMMKHFPIYFSSKFKNVTSSKRPIIRLMHVNSNLNNPLLMGLTFLGSRTQLVDVNGFLVSSSW